MDVIRVSNYTSIQGDDSKLTDISRRISQTWFNCSAGQVKGEARIVPRVFKKDAGSKRSRLVDIQITIDIMNAAASASVDAIQLVSGDGDFLPLKATTYRTQENKSEDRDDFPKGNKWTRLKTSGIFCFNVDQM